MTVLPECIKTPPPNGTIVYLAYPYNKHGHIAFKFNQRSKQHWQLLKMGYLFYSNFQAVAMTKAMHKAKCRAINCITVEPSDSDILYLPILYDKKKNQESIIYNSKDQKCIWLYNIGFLFETSGNALLANIAMKQLARKQQ